MQKDMSHTKPLKPGTSSNPDQKKAVMADQKKTHNMSVSDSKGKRPTVVSK